MAHRLHSALMTGGEDERREPDHDAGAVIGFSGRAQGAEAPAPPVKHQ